MARSVASIAVIFAAAFLLVAGTVRETDAAITCSMVVTTLSPCIGYVRGMGALTKQCCGGVRSLNNAATTTPDRKLACSCLKSLSGQIPNLKLNLAAGLPRLCGVNVPYVISPSTDCSTVH